MINFYYDNILYSTQNLQNGNLHEMSIIFIIIFMIFFLKLN